MFDHVTIRVSDLAASEAHAFWQAGVDAGHRDDGAPGPRPEYYGGFLLDPGGNSAEAVNHNR